MDTYFKIQYIHCLHSAFSFYFYSYFRDSKIQSTQHPVTCYYCLFSLTQLLFYIL